MINVLSSADLHKGAESFSEVWAPPTDKVIMRMMINTGHLVPNNCFDLRTQTGFWNATSL